LGEHVQIALKAARVAFRCPRLARNLNNGGHGHPTESTINTTDEVDSCSAAAEENLVESPDGCYRVESSFMS
jgi:hypothetical protein